MDLEFLGRALASRRATYLSHHAVVVVVVVVVAVVVDSTIPSNPAQFAK